MKRKLYVKTAILSVFLLSVDVWRVLLFVNNNHKWMIIFNITSLRNVFKGRLQEKSD